MARPAIDGVFGPFGRVTQLSLLSRASNADSSMSAQLSGLSLPPRLFRVTPLRSVQPSLWVVLSGSGGRLTPSPNVLFFHVDNLGFGELSCYSGGPFRGCTTKRIDAFAAERMRLTSYCPESQCTPTSSALFTGRHAIRSGARTVRRSVDRAAGVWWRGRRRWAICWTRPGMRVRRTASGMSGRVRGAGRPTTGSASGTARRAPATRTSGRLTRSTSRAATRSPRWSRSSGVRPTSPNASG
jgi:hypothetical protein